MKVRWPRATGAVLIAACGAFGPGCGSGSGGGADAASEAELDAAGDGQEDALADVSEAAADASADTAVDGGIRDAAPGGETALDGQANTGTVTITADATLAPGPDGAAPCAAVDSLTASPAEALTGHTIVLTASGLDGAGQRSDVVLTWEALGFAGTLSISTGSSVGFACNGPGTETITVTATVGPGASCPGTGTLSVDVICD